MLPLLLIPFVARSSEPLREMNRLLAKSRFFELEDMYNRYCDKLKPLDKLYFSAHIDNASGQYRKSNATIGEIVDNYANKLTSRRIIELISIQSDNHAKLYEYGAAAESLRVIYSKYRSKLSRKEQEDMSNMLRMWHSLKDVAPQIVHTEKYTQTEVPIRYNEYNHCLLQISNQTREDSVEFIFDSGANISVVSHTTAEKLVTQRIQNNVNVGNSVGSELQSGLGYIPVIYIGSIKIENMVVLILPDSDLSIGGYSIDGIIGFPVIQALGEFSISRNGVFSVSPRLTENENIAPHVERNIFTCGFTPLVKIMLNNRPGNFIFDTGARTSHITKNYFRANKKFFDDHKSENIRIGGAGQIKNIKRRVVKNCKIEIAKDKFELPTIDVLFNNGLRLKSYDGFLGQDVLLQSDKVVINLRDMYLIFE